MDNIVNENKPFFRAIRKNWAWHVLFGVLLMIAGVYAAAYSTFVTTVVMLWLGVLLLVSALLHLFYAFSTKTKSTLFLDCFLALLGFILGVYFIAFPAKVGVFFTLLVGVFLILRGLFRIIYSFLARDIAIWWLILFTGLIAIILGVLILASWPSSGLWIIGLYIGIEIFLSGLCMFMLAISARISN